ncbi:chitinase [Streptomyces sp. P17]|uniref:chitinase n=1 Tax=Streptomyces sp. P17 TaxID=3074716 RepID=UPI0028F45DA5|nr:chitinase [Streptomyces sp. P17]MDT9701737.1 chitinase [Streptomyces sp. P17]
MRSSLKAMPGLAILFALAMSGCTAPSGSAEPTESPTPYAPYAPYVSVLTASANDTAGSPTTYNLAFAIADGSDCTPSWSGVHRVGDSGVAARIAELKKSGATVRVSFGGASGDELATHCDSASTLAKAYGEALDAAGSTQADFDIEGDELSDADSVDLRSKAIALLQQEREDLTVSFTLPVMPSGLDDDSIALLNSANNHAVEVSTVNLMTMNYGESYDGDMGDYAITAAKAAHTQLRDVFGTSASGAWRGMALTSMIGVNDVDGETFTLQDATQVREFAQEKGIGWVSMWSTLRDQECAEDATLTNCSGVEQEDGEFGEAFAG